MQTEFWLNQMRACYPLYEHTPLMCLNCIPYKQYQEKATLFKRVQPLLRNLFRNAAVGLPPGKTHFIRKCQLCTITKQETRRVPVKIIRKVEDAAIVL